MAPALVEHSAAEERNSVSKEYRKFRTYFSQFDIGLLKKLAFTDSASLFSEKSTTDRTILEMNNCNRKEKPVIDPGELPVGKSLANDLSSMTTVKNILSCNAKPGYKNGMFNYKLEGISITGDSSPTSSSDTNNVPSSMPTYDCETYRVRPRQPVATTESSIIAELQSKRKSCSLKFFDLNRSMNRLNTRIRQMQSSNVSSHVACHVNKVDTLISGKSEDSLETKDLKDDVLNHELRVRKPWQDLKKVHDMVVIKTGNGDVVDDLNLKQRIPLVRTKKRSDNPPPPPDALHEWKVKRAHIGSQCSWLNLKIRSLDKKISELDRFHEKLKYERKSAKTEARLETNSRSGDSAVSKNELNSVPASTDDQICRRVLPYSKVYHHKYIRKPSDVTNSGCRCLPSISSCRLCVQSQNGAPSSCTRKERVGKLDESYHGILSNENDISLAFLLEEKLRKERINTKVTISKPTKKKKKKRKEAPLENPLGKNSGGNRSSSKVTSEKTYGKSRCDRLKGDELPRKRSAGESSVRSRKLRKLSESDETWKPPSTPTNDLNSPFSQSAPSGAFFPIKQQRKKNATGGDYDINNIVIPYSMAASTRLERIQYKEIPTPGWRNAAVDSAAPSGDVECDELTDDDLYAERHMRCEVTERRKFSDYFQPVVRRQRPYHLSESTASGPPSPSVGDELLRINNPLDSPLLNAPVTDSRCANVAAVPVEEWVTPWTSRTFPLPESECSNLITPNSGTAASCNDNVTVAERVPPLRSPVSSSLVSIPEGTPLQTTIHTPLETPVPSPLCSPNGTPAHDWSADNPNNWTVKVLDDPIVDVVTTESQRKGIVLKLAKK